MARRDRQSLADPFDLLIIGGGITGAGAARDAARRGLRVALLDQGDLASGTSSRSSKLVHGGLRYLEQGEFSLVFEAVAERRILQEIAPHLVNPMPFLFPVFGGSRRGVFTINVGMWLYDGLSLFRSPKIHKNLSVRQVRAQEPSLRSEGLKGAPVYYDCATDDARLTLETALDAAAHGAVLATHTRVTGFVRGSGGRVQGVDAVDVLSGETLQIQATAVINATGPWSDRTRGLDDHITSNRLRPTKGIHIVIESERLKLAHAVVGFHPEDGRVFFSIPWGEQTYIGTTDTDFQGDPGEAAATSEDVDYVLGASAFYFPDAALTRADVISTWAGVRPLICEEAAGNESSVSREHLIRLDEDGLITIAGGKLTTYRRMGAEVVDKAVDLLRMLGQAPENRPAQTDISPLPGAVGWPPDDDHEAVARQVLQSGAESIELDTARLLANTYGMRGTEVAELAAAQPALAARLIPGRPEILAQVVFAVERELAATISDFFIRRSQLYYRDRDQGLSAVDTVAECMGAQLGWSAEQAQVSAEQYRAEVARSREWQAG
jgi:glycerol-3-phosphate dehydrogenase